MSRHFYAVYWPYGVNTFNFDHEPIGTVVPFDTTKARDAYVAADRFDGNFHRSVPDYRLMRSCVMTCSVTLIRGRRECHGNIEIVG